MESSSAASADAITSPEGLGDGLAEFAPITTSDLQGRARKRGMLLVADGAGNVVLRAALRKSAKPAYAVFRTASGEWRIERRRRDWTGRGPEPLSKDRLGWDLVVLDSAGQTAAIKQGDEVVLPDGERLTWVGSTNFFTSCGLGGDLWVAKGNWFRRKRFRAELSGVMLAREDRELLTGLAAVLTHLSLMGDHGAGGAADLGASIGFGLG